ncbi:MAG TPA: hypothetical protein VMX56_07655, partial [Anaerolineales bacterium]|nr:hypothetical protein [Anaerolineales bacterium]
TKSPELIWINLLELCRKRSAVIMFNTKRLLKAQTRLKAGIMWKQIGLPLISSEGVQGRGNL